MDRTWTTWAIGVAAGIAVGVMSCGAERDADYVGARAGGVVTPDAGAVVGRDGGVASGTGGGTPGGGAGAGVQGGVGGGATSTTTATWSWTCSGTTTGKVAADGGAGCPGVCLYASCHMCTMRVADTPDAQAAVAEACIESGGESGLEECPMDALLGCCLRMGGDVSTVDCFYDGFGVSAAALEAQCTAAGLHWTDFAWACL